MKPFSVNLTEHVQQQITDHMIYILEEGSFERALGWERRLRAAILEIGSVIGFAVDEEASIRFGRPVRKFVFERTYLIHYCVDETAGRVDVIGFRHGARLPRRDEP